METQCIHVQKKYCSDRVCAGNSIKTLGFNDCFTTSVWLWAKWVTDFEILGNIKVNMNDFIT